MYIPRQALCCSPLQLHHSLFKHRAALIGVCCTNPPLGCPKVELGRFIPSSGECLLHCTQLLKLFMSFLPRLTSCVESFCCQQAERRHFIVSGYVDWLRQVHTTCCEDFARICCRLNSLVRPCSLVRLMPGRPACMLRCKDTEHCQGSGLSCYERQGGARVLPCLMSTLQ